MPALWRIGLSLATGGNTGGARRRQIPITRADRVHMKKGPEGPFSVNARSLGVRFAVDHTGGVVQQALGRCLDEGLQALAHFVLLRRQLYPIGTRAGAQLIVI